MNIQAKIQNEAGKHQVVLSTNGDEHSVSIAPKSEGMGSSVNGGELLFLALATCYCNDIYREAGKRGIEVRNVDVTVDGEFGAEGEPARNVVYHAKVVASGATEDEVKKLLIHTDTVAEIQNTLRVATPIRLDSVEVDVIV